MTSASFLNAGGTAGVNAAATPSRLPEQTPSLMTERNCLSLPAWFPADKAAAVLRQQKKQFALMADHQGVSRVASLEQLSQAPETKSVLWCGRRLGPAVSPSTSVVEARRLLDAHPDSFLPVVLGGAILGILSLSALPELSPATHQATSTQDQALSLAA